jgi:hypothetical protein
LAQGQELTVRKRRTKTSLQDRKKKRKNRKTYLTHTGLLMEGVGRARPCLSTQRIDNGFILKALGNGIGA